MTTVPMALSSSKIIHIFLVLDRIAEHIIELRPQWIFPPCLPGGATWFRALVRQSIHDKFAQDEDDREEITNYPCRRYHRASNIRWER
jgi:hypothetical protein